MFVISSLVPLPFPNPSCISRSSNYHIVAFISHTSKVMLKILQAILQQYMNQELPDVQAGFRKGRGTRKNCQYLLHNSKSKGIQEKISASLTTLKPLTVWITINCGKLLKRWNTRPDYLPTDKPVCRSRSNRTRHGTTDWFKIGKGVYQGCILSPCLFNLYAEYIMQNAGWFTS